MGIIATNFVIAVLIERQANTVVDWEEIRAQKAKR